MSCILHPITRVSVYPGYDSGFTFEWDVFGGFNDPMPWEFTVQRGLSPDGPWEDISDPVINILRCDVSGCFLTNKGNTLYFRLKLKTDRGIYFSDYVTPYGDLDRREFLIAREIMRKEVLYCKTWSGVLSDLYLLNESGSKCSHCIDPITGQVRDSHCLYCFGTGKEPPYFGPYSCWASFSTDDHHTKQHGQDGGTIEPKKFTVRLIGTPTLNKNDILIDPRSDKRYYINTVSVITEIRRIPIIQMLSVSEASLSDVIYKL